MKFMITVHRPDDTISRLSRNPKRNTLMPPIQTTGPLYGNINLEGSDASHSIKVTKFADYVKVKKDIKDFFENQFEVW